jgi:hypothetical protein
MHVNKAIETPNGTVVFEGELEPLELDLVLKVGLNVLLQAGALPFVVKDEASTTEEHDTLQ